MNLQPRAGQGRTSLWGLVRPAPGVASVRSIEYRNRGSQRWRLLKRHPTDARGYWSTTTLVSLGLRLSGALGRVRWRADTSLRALSGATQDRRDASAVKRPASLSGLEEAFGEGAEEVAAGDHAGYSSAVDDRDDQDAVVEEDLGELGVRVVGADVDVLAVHVLLDALAAAGVALFEGLVEGAAQEGGALELVEVAGEQGAHELAFAEDAGVAARGVDDGQGGEVAVEQSPDGVFDRVVGVEGFRVAQ